MRLPSAAFTLLVLLASCSFVFGETVRDREAAVRTDLSTMKDDARWIYNDIERGFAEAEKTKKPLLVVLRCVPCLACRGIDASILNSKELQPVLDNFVCVRVINANNLDLSRFQFDYDLSFSTLLFNADGTIYGRYGSWRHQRDARDSTTSGYKAALNAALALHKDFPANKEALAGKQGGPVPFAVPVEIPALAGKYGRDLNWDGKVVQSCVHCHQIGDAFRAWHRNQGKPVPPDLIYPMPMPETVGLTLHSEFVARVSEVEKGSLAEAAGLKAGDDLVTVNGQPLISIADFAWVLHRAPESGALKIAVNRVGAAQTVTLALPKGWRQKSDISKRVGTWPMRAMAFGGMVLMDLTDEERAKRGLKTTGMALLAKYVGNFGPDAVAKKAGLLKDDLVIAADGLNQRISEGELIGHLLTNRMQKEILKLTVIRGDKTMEFAVPMQ